MLGIVSKPPHASSIPHPAYQQKAGKLQGLSSLLSSLSRPPSSFLPSSPFTVTHLSAEEMSTISFIAIVAILHSLVGHGYAFLLPHQPSSKALPTPLSPLYRNHQVFITTRSITPALKSTASELETILSNLDDDTDLPILHINKRIGSGSYGTVHQCYLINSKKDITPCVAKRSWSYEEIQASVPKKINDADRIVIRTGLANPTKLEMEEKVLLSEEEIETASERCAHYWEVERHCFHKLKKCSDEDNDVLLKKAIPTFLGVYNDDGSGMESNDLIEGYGLINESKEGGGWFDNDNEKHRVGHDWMVFETVESFEDGEDVLTLLDAMDVRGVHAYYVYGLSAQLNIGSSIHTTQLDWKDQHSQKYTNHLHDVKVAMGLPESFDFGDVLDRIFESLLENLTAIHERNIVHRDCELYFQIYHCRCSM